MDVYAALTAPWETPPDVLLAAVHAARVMPRPESQQERYCRWSEEHVNYPAPLCDLPSLRANPSSDSRQRALMRFCKADATDCAGESGAADGGATMVSHRPSLDFEKPNHAPRPRSEQNEPQLSPSDDSRSRERPASAYHAISVSWSQRSTACPPALAHASAVADGAGGRAAWSGRTVNSSARQTQRKAETRFGDERRRLGGLGGPRLHPTQRLPAPILRRALIDQALSYLGTPYMRSASKSVAEHNPWCRQLPALLKAAAPVPGAHDRAGLELDCSAFIRQAVVDLQRHFGFVLGGWNQAYQFDTLPLAVQTVQELEPGDLIFISGVYFDEKRKSKPHNLTHVEMFFPCGPERTQTIGSRHKTGCVQVHQDFRFESKTYHSMQYHFRKIDTWLQGECRSFCPQHRWTNG